MFDDLWPLWTLSDAFYSNLPSRRCWCGCCWRWRAAAASWKVETSWVTLRKTLGSFLMKIPSLASWSAAPSARRRSDALEAFDGTLEAWCGSRCVGCRAPRCRGRVPTKCWTIKKLRRAWAVVNWVPKFQMTAKGGCGLTGCWRRQGMAMSGLRVTPRCCRLDCRVWSL